MAPMESFTHTFLESGDPQKEPAAGADVIFADLRDMDAACAAGELISWKRPETELILLAEREQMDVLSDCLPQIQDIWILPMSDEELRFRFLRWQQSCNSMAQRAQADGQAASCRCRICHRIIWPTSMVRAAS